MSRKHPQSILVLRAGAIGDFVLTLPALRTLRMAFPKAHIELMGYPAIAELAHRRFYADAVSRVDSADMAAFFTSGGREAPPVKGTLVGDGSSTARLSPLRCGAPLPEQTAARLRAFDLAICFWKDEPGVLEANLRRAGLKEVLAVNPFPPEGSKVHAAVHMLEALAPLVGRGHDPSPRIFLNDDDRAFAAQFIEQLKTPSRGPLLAAHPGSGGRHKIWPAPRFAALMEMAAAEKGARWLLIRGPADAKPCGEVQENLSRVRPIIVEGLSLVHLASVLSACAGYVGNDSGITHVAAAVGAPTVAVFGPTDPAVWGPLGTNSCVVSASPPSWPSVEQVWSSLSRLVSA